ncbi:hypothetical protein DZK27_02740 [Rhodobacteraceae bacterium 63075]|nr:hypothetical protein DZK27_02740 [Rhodobacteraceae bacterium 63075]
MIERERLSTWESDLLALFETRLGVRAETLARALKKAGRRLPARQRQNGQRIVEALKRADHPRLAVQNDARDLPRAHEELTAHLEGIDRRERKIRAALRLTATIAFNLLFVAAAVIVILRWRDFL